MKKAIRSRLGQVTRPMSDQVLRWPEFISFAKRLGIDLDIPLTGLKIELKDNELVKIAQTYLADNIDQQNSVTHLEEGWEE